jgi:hypothetical protein
MSYELYERLGFGKIATRCFPVVPVLVEIAQEGIADSVMGLVLSFIDPLFEERGAAKISTVSCFKLFGYSTWNSFFRAVTGIGSRSGKAILSNVYYNAVYSIKVSVINRWLNLAIY